MKRSRLPDNGRVIIGCWGVVASDRLPLLGPFLGVEVDILRGGRPISFFMALGNKKRATRVVWVTLFGFARLR